MKKIYLIISLLFLVATQLATAQCTIDSTQIIPGAYPDTIADATVNHPYTQDITFVMVTDTLGFTISNYLIDGITGLPFGFTWTCNNIATGCNYDPAVNLYGCINLSGTTLIAGSYVLNITIIATVAGIGDQALNYFLPLNVFPDTVGNAGFSMTSATGCDPLTVSFINNIPGQLSYLWDFGNSVTDTAENPLPQTYIGPGDYVVTQTITPLAPTQYFLTEITIDSIPDNYNIGFPADNNFDPDMYFLVLDTAGNTVYDSRPAITDTPPPYTWTPLNIPLMDEMYTIQVFDLDSFIINLGDDPLGQISFAGWGTSGTATDTLSGVPGELNLSYTISQISVPPIVYTDTVHVLPSPPVPIVTASGALTFCDGDSVTLTSSSATDNQWFESINLLPGDTSQTLVVKTSGDYAVVVSSASGCTSSSLANTVTVNLLPPKPAIIISGDSIVCTLTGFNLQWYLNGTIVNGQTGQIIVPLVSGTYTVVATDGNGCTNSSDPLLFQGVGIDEFNTMLNQVVITPNPSNGQFIISFEPSHPADLKLVISDVTGRLVYSTERYNISGNYSMNVDLGHQQKGIYLLELMGNGFSIKRKLVIAGQE